MVFAASPVGENFRMRSQRFLATVTSTVIDWFQPWPEASLFSVAKKFLDEVDLGDDSIRTAVVEFMPYRWVLVGVLVFLDGRVLMGQGCTTAADFPLIQPPTMCTPCSLIPCVSCSFALVNKISKKFFDSERRYNYTTPKTFLELIKLYKNVLGNKRKATQVTYGVLKRWWREQGVGMRQLRQALGRAVSSPSKRVAPSTG